MFELHNALHTMPSGEHLTARKATKMRFIQLESEQLRSHIEDLESSLSIYKQILKDLVYTKTEKSMTDETESQSVISPRIIETLISEKRVTEERVRRITIERNDAIHKARNSENVAKIAQTREDRLVMDYDKKINDFLKLSEERENIIYDLEKKNSILEQDLYQFNISRGHQLSEVEQQDLLYKKIDIMVEIIKKLKDKQTKIEKGNDDLIRKTRPLCVEYSKANALLREPQRDMDLDEILIKPKPELTINEFYTNGPD